jgi:hypothetical protein
MKKKTFKKRHSFNRRSVAFKAHRRPLNKCREPSSDHLNIRGGDSEYWIDGSDAGRFKSTTTEGRAVLLGRVLAPSVHPAIGHIPNILLCERQAIILQTSTCRAFVRPMFTNGWVNCADSQRRSYVRCRNHIRWPCCSLRSS